MEVTKFWTKGKIIFLLIILGIGLSFFLISYHKKSTLKKEYIKLENLLTLNAPYYMQLEGIELELGEWREINIKDVFKRGLAKNSYSSDCKGYIIASSDEETENIDFQTYIKCGKIYTTMNYGSKLSEETQNTTETQSQNDTIKPVIELIGRKEMTIKLNSKYKDPGVVATDNVDGDITSKVKSSGDVDITTEGTYVVKYTVKDNAGNIGTAERSIEVKSDAVEESGDTTKPVISFKSEIVSTICIGEKLEINADGLYGYSAYDDTDGDITSNVKISGSTGNINIPGSYTITYAVSDKAGNKTTAQRSFNVKNCSDKNSAVTIQNPKNYVDEGTEVKGVNASCPTSIPLGEKGKITTYVYPKSATNRNVTYVSDNTSVLKIDAFGNIKTISKGTAVVTIKSVGNPNVTSTCEIIVE